MADHQLKDISRIISHSEFNGFVKGLAFSVGIAVLYFVMKKETKKETE